MLAAPKRVDNSRDNFANVLTQKEGFKSSPELMKQWLDNQKPYKTEHQYVVSVLVPVGRNRRQPGSVGSVGVRLTMRAADRAPRARIDDHTRIEVGFVATLTVPQPRGG